MSLLEDHCRQRQLPHPDVFLFDCAVGSTVIVISALGGCRPPLSLCPPVRMSAQWPSVPSHDVCTVAVRAVPWCGVICTSMHTFACDAFTEAASKSIILLPSKSVQQCRTLIRLLSF